MMGLSRESETQESIRRLQIIALGLLGRIMGLLSVSVGSARSHNFCTHS